MSYFALAGALTLSLVVQAQPNCTGITLEVDARCGCVKDPGSQLCELVKKGFYDTNGPKVKPISVGLSSGWNNTSPSSPKPSPTVRSSKPAQARVVPLPSK